MQIQGQGRIDFPEIFPRTWYPEISIIWIISDDLYHQALIFPLAQLALFLGPQCQLCQISPCPIS